MTTRRFTIRDTVKAIIRSSGDYIGTFQADWPELDEEWPDGTDSNEADRFWCDIGRTVLTGADDDLDLSSLSNGPAGTAVTFVEVRGVWIRNRVTNTTKLTLKGSGAANPFTGWGAALLDIVIGSTFRYVSPSDGKLPVSGGSKVIRLTNAAGATNTFDVLIIGTSA